MNPKEAYELSSYNGLKIASQARRLERISSVEKLVQILGSLNYPKAIHILGSGTNTLWGSPFIDKTVLKMEIPGFQILEEARDSTLIEIGAGENWDNCVERSVELNLSGLEALSGIPGTVGAGPVQNIGAYGNEIGGVLESVTIFDKEEMCTKVLDKSACQFSYRDSIFKHSGKNLIITSIVVRLSKHAPSIPNYPDVIKYFRDHSTPPNLQSIRDAILKIRSSKLPDPKVIPNCGSFFKNPVVDRDQAHKLKSKFPTMPQYQFEDRIKISAGWLIDNLGLKGKRFGGIEVYKNNALVLTAPESNAVIEDVINARDYISREVESHFGLELEMEPEIVI